MKKNPPLESEIQSDILKELRKKGLFCWRNNSGFIPVKGKNGHTRRVVVGKTGLPDILGFFKDGHAFAIEVKRDESSPLRPSQIVSQQQLYTTKVYCIVAWSVQQVMDEFMVIIDPDQFI